MSELVFPISALAVILLIVTPALTALSCRALARRRRSAPWADFGDGTTWMWLVLPVALPLGWLLSAALHQLEPGEALAACRLDHLEAACIDAALLVGLIGGLMAFARRRGFDAPGPMRRLSHGAVAERTRRLVQATPALRRWPVHIIDGPDRPAVFTYGALWPILAVRSDFARAAFAERDAERLRAALMHEAAHAGKRDVLRMGLLRAALWLNPARRWLSADAERWRDAREAACDREAVGMGADPLALAQSLVRAAGPAPTGLGPTALAALCGHDGATLRLRVALLLHGARPSRPSKRGLVLAVCAIGLAFAAEVGRGEGALEHFHHAVESWIGHG